MVRTGSHGRHLVGAPPVRTVDDGKFRRIVLLFLLVSGATFCFEYAHGELFNGRSGMHKIAGFVRKPLTGRLAVNA